MNNRPSELASLLPDGVDAALIISEANRRYFTGFTSSLGYLFVTRNGAFLIVDSRYEEAAGKQAKDCTVIPMKKLGDTVRELITQQRLRSIMLEGSAFTLNDAADMEKIFRPAGATAVKSKDLDRMINRMRIIKTSDEIEKIHRAQFMTEYAFAETIKLIREGVSERELALELEFRMRKIGAERVSFDLIVLSGANTSMPHGVPGENRVKNGDFVLFDIGAVYEGYHSDMTRTVAFGKVDQTSRRIYETVRKAQQKALDAVREGVSCMEVDKAARSYIYTAGYEGMFGHSTGHGVGVEIHEEPSVSPSNDYILRSGMVITVEPGIYVPGKCGVRIEDMVVVTADGCINLANVPKELIEL